MTRDIPNPVNTPTYEDKNDNTSKKIRSTWILYNTPGITNEMKKEVKIEKKKSNFFVKAKLAKKRNSPKK